MKRFIKAGYDRVYNKLPDDVTTFCDYLWDNYEIDCEVNRDLTRIHRMRYHGHIFGDHSFKHVKAGSCLYIPRTRSSENIDDIISQYVESDSFKECYKCMQICGNIYDFLDDPGPMESYLSDLFVSKRYPGISGAKFMSGMHFVTYWPDIAGVEVSVQYVLTDAVYDGQNLKLGTEDDCSACNWGIGPWVYEFEVRMDPEIHDYQSLLSIFKENVGRNFGNFLYENIQQVSDVYPEAVRWAKSFVQLLDTFLSRKGYELKYGIYSEKEFFESMRYDRGRGGTVLVFYGLKSLDSENSDVSLYEEYIHVSQIDNEETLYNKFTKRFSRAIYRNKRKIN